MAKDACYHKVKSRYSVWPSAYGSGALAKCRKVGAANWGNSKKKDKGGVIKAKGGEIKTLKKVAKQLDKASAMHAMQAKKVRKHAEKMKKSGGRVRKTAKGLALKRWFKEDWRTPGGDKDYSKGGKTFRPTKRISSKTPKTWSELSKADKERAAKEKREKGRVSRYNYGGSIKMPAISSKMIDSVSSRYKRKKKNKRRLA
jgi:hypothetical protein